MKRIPLFIAALFVCGTLTAAAPFGGTPYELFDQKACGYQLIGNSLLDDQATLWGEGANRQGDTCIDRSTAIIKHPALLDKPTVVKAYLIWMGAVDPAKLAEPTDNMVHLSFSRTDGYLKEADIIAGDTARYLGDTSDPFLFESVRFTADVPVDCSETVAGTMTTAELAYFTYRVDVTDFFTAIAADNQASADPLKDGAPFYGDYTVSGLDCTDVAAYRCSTLMVSNWTLFIAYFDNSQPINIALYPGFAFKQNETAEVTLSDLEIPNELMIRMTMLAAEGDPAVDPTQETTERLFVWDALWQENRSLGDDCDPNDTTNGEIWDSRTNRILFTEQNGVMGYCTDPEEKYHYGLDIDSWILDWGPDPKITELLPVGTTDMNLSFDFSADEVLTNLFIVSVNAPLSQFDIPGKEELRNCPCAAEESQEVFCAGEPQYFLISVENWGNYSAESVYLKATYDPMVFDYVPDSTEIATQFDESGNGLNWQRFLDGPQGSFPLTGPNLIANELHSLFATPEKAISYLIRFQLLPKKGLPKNRFGEVRATVSDQTSYFSVNHNIPMRLYQGICATTCTEKELQTRCGGVSATQTQIYNPGETSTDDDIVDTDETTDVLPDDIIDPRSTHPMKDQDPGCSLIII
ncbi:MAG TPA: hypothetical protein PLV42_04280 [bacterium]|nr:hypothetical protein [bacterium]